MQAGRQLRNVRNCIIVTGANPEFKEVLARNRQIHARSLMQQGPQAAGFISRRQETNHHAMHEIVFLSN